MNIKRALELDEVRHVIGKPKPEKQAKKPRNPPIDKEAILYRRFGSPSLFWCECECVGIGHDLHHAFIGRKKGYPILDDERNLVLVNHDEHIARKFDNQEWRKKFWSVQIRRYGKEKMLEWVNSLPPKMCSRIDWL